MELIVYPFFFRRLTLKPFKRIIFTMTDKSNAQFVIRNLQHNDIPDLMLLPRLEGREMGREPEVSTWLNIDPHGIFIAVNIKDGSIAGCCSGIALSESHGYIGMFVVKSVHRGTGLGRILWQAAINRLGNRNLSLSSAANMLPFYKERAGFRLAAEWTVDLYKSTQTYLPSLTNCRLLPYTVFVKPKSSCVQSIIDYDRSIHKYDRSMIVTETVNEAGTVTAMSMKFTNLNEIVTTGYACMKESLQGHWLIAPLYADDYFSAKSLIYHLLNSLTNEQRQEGVVAKLVSTNYEASKLFKEFGLIQSSYQLQRLFTKEVFEIPVNKVFALQTSVFCTE